MTKKCVLYSIFPLHPSVQFVLLWLKADNLENGTCVLPWFTEKERSGVFLKDSQQTDRELSCHSLGSQGSCFGQVSDCKSEKLNFAILNSFRVNTFLQLPYQDGTGRGWGHCSSVLHGSAFFSPLLPFGTGTCDSSSNTG